MEPNYYNYAYDGDPEVTTTELPHEFYFNDWKWAIVIGDDFTVRFKTKPPGPLKCFMYKFLLGWEIRTGKEIPA
jgi:hypothetical protein